ncbi:hypothetical protein Tco_0213127 [Tanacetum coccineum]
MRSRPNNKGHAGFIGTIPSDTDRTGKWGIHQYVILSRRSFRKTSQGYRHQFECHATTITVPLDGLHLDDKLHFVEEPLEIVGHEVKRLKRSRIPLVKVRWNSKRGPEFTWEREDQFRKKYPHLFIKTAPSSSAGHRKP